MRFLGAAAMLLMFAGVSLIIGFWPLALICLGFLLLCLVGIAQERRGY